MQETIKVAGKEYYLRPVEEKAETETEIIEVPMNILFVNYGDNVYLSNGNQVLGYNKQYNHWTVSTVTDSCINLNKAFMQLIKCNYEDIEVGEFFYGSDYDLEYINQLIYYNLKIEGGYQYWNRKNCVNIDVEFAHYYKITPIT